MSDWRALYPFASRYLALDGARLHYLDEGPPAAEPLLLLHGNPTWSFYWRNLILAWRDRRRVIAVDHVGCGLSDKPAAYDYRLARRIADVTRLIDELDLRPVTLVAHDWGGAIGLGVVLARPDRFARLVLLNTGAYVPPAIPGRIRICRTPLLGRLAVQGLNLFARAALSMAVEHRDRLTGPARGGLLAPYDSWGHRRAIYEFVADIPLRPRDRSYQTLAEIEAGLTTLRDRPTLLAWGMRDWCFTPAVLERMRGFFPDAEVETFADAGHYVVEDAYERIAPRVEQFLDSHPVA